MKLVKKLNNKLFLQSIFKKSAEKSAEKSRGILPYIGAVLSLIFLLFPASAHGSIISFLENLISISDREVSAHLLSPANSQTISLLRATLNADPNPIKGGGDIAIVGGTALLPEMGPEGSSANLKEGNENGSISTYVVRDGDTLSEIAEMFNVSINTIRWANDLKSLDDIKTGQTLVILPISGIQHKVRSGDTIISIAKKYNADAKDIIRYNDLSERVKLAAGDIIVVPDAELSAVSPSSKPRSFGADAPYIAGYYAKPLSSYVKTQGLHGYNGVDLGAEKGSPVFASAGGEIIAARESGWNGGYGIYVVIAHQNGTQTLYAHMNALDVAQGTVVKRGEVIGYVGSTGNSTGPHLHFEIRGAKNPF